MYIDVHGATAGNKAIAELPAMRFPKKTYDFHERIIFQSGSLELDILDLLVSCMPHFMMCHDDTFPYISLVVPTLMEPDEMPYRGPWLSRLDRKDI